MEQSSIQDRVASKTFARFGTFQGVFCPTLLTILGVIMFLRLGWVVGQSGLLGAWSIILLASCITLFTALSVSSITTNIRIGSGGAFSIISQSLGLEVGGSIGIPLFLCQALAVALYVFGFREGWQTLYPEHSAVWIDLATFACLFLISLLSTEAAFKIQYILLAILAVALVSIFSASPIVSELPQRTPLLVKSSVGYWTIFAVFFPAVTGIMAGLNMSGELVEPRKSIPQGTLWAIAVSTVLYLALAWWCWWAIPKEQLATNYTVLLECSRWPWAVTAGLLGATFSSGLSSLVGAPRILQALGQHNIVPGSSWLSRQTSRGEPRNAMLVTGLVVMAALLLRQVNVLAPLLTMFFLIAYGMLNLVTALEQRMNLSSFRPLLRVPTLIPFLGAAGCLFAMLIIHPLASVLAIALVFGFYGVLLSRKLEAPHGDMRSGMFVSVAEWAAKKVAGLPGSERAWRPSLLIPVEDTTRLKGQFSFLCALAYPQGTLKLVGVPGSEEDAFREDLESLASAFRCKEIHTSWTLLDTGTYDERVLHAIQALGGAFFRPNILYLSLPGENKRDDQLRVLISEARRLGLGVVLYHDDPKTHLGCEQVINVWIRDQSPHWELSMDLGNKDMSLLTAYLLNNAWKGRVRLVCVLGESKDREKAGKYLTQLLDLSRLPEVEIEIVEGPFGEVLSRAPEADLNILGLSEQVDLTFVRACTLSLKTTCVFTRDSGRENVLA